jgi:hypothetical protein
VTLKLRLSLDIEYEPGTTTENQLREMLTRMVDHAMGVGLITGETDAEVETWNMRVHKVGVLQGDQS